MSLDPRRYQLSEAANERIFRDRIVPGLLEGATRQQNPVVVFVGGQTGAGKTATTQMIASVLQQRGRFLNVNMDFYNPLHPDYQRLRADDEASASAYVRADGDRWWARAQTYAIEQRADVVLETAMRTEAEFERLVGPFKDAGYRAEAALMAVPEALSRLGMVARYWNEVRTVGHGRYVDVETHDACYRRVIRAAEAIDAMHLTDSVFVFRRTGSAVYANHLDDASGWAAPPMTAHAVVAERQRTWTDAELTGFRQSLSRLRVEMGPPWQTELHDIARLAPHPSARVPRPAIPGAATLAAQAYPERLTTVQQPSRPRSVPPAVPADPRTSRPNRRDGPSR